GGTIYQCSKELHTNKNLVKQIDKKRLINLAGDMKPKHFSPFISVDEFSLHKHHEYATVVIDYCTGESIFVTQGKTYGQMLEFFRFVGHEFMNQVVAVSMDMNASYAKAFKELYPHIKIVYDGFHLVKNYNDMVLTEIRRFEQRRLMNEIDNAVATGDKTKYIALKEEYKLFKGSRYLLLGNKKTLEIKDAAACEHNTKLFEKFEKKGLKLPIGKHYWSANSIKRLDEVLQANERLQTAHILGEMLKSSLRCRDQKEFDSGFKKWLMVARNAKIPELDRYCDLISRHWIGIRNRIQFPISNGPIEGTNCLIKNIRRQSYGIRDDEYFFLKIWEATRKHPKERKVA
ncbi:MAG: ISL3 family transposase, partial [Sphaerochaetaceae bacterium]|nr:ISL3 family transposase [Sphaerochaetaceae bacterium]